MKTDTHATTAEQSLKSTLKAINDIVIIEEDEAQYEAGNYTGFSEASVNAVKTGLLVIPQIAEDAMKKFQRKGVIISIGEKVVNLKVGLRVIFAPLAGLRHQHNGKNLVILRGIDILAIESS